jgi:hypothetical protein
MMSEGEILRELQRFIGTLINGAFTGEVISNSDAESKAIIEVVKGLKVDGQEQLTYNVRLKSIIDESDKHLIAIPPVGSQVFCISVGNSDERYVAVSFNEIEKIIYKGENVSIVIDDNEGTVVLNDGENGGLIKIEGLVSKINVLESKVNELLQTLQAVVIPLAPSGTYPLATDFADVTPLQPETQVSDLENDKVKH